MVPFYQAQRLCAAGVVRRPGLLCADLLLRHTSTEDPKAQEVGRHWAVRVGNLQCIGAEQLPCEPWPIDLVHRTMGNQWCMCADCALLLAEAQLLCQSPTFLEAHACIAVPLNHHNGAGPLTGIKSSAMPAASTMGAIMCCLSTRR